MIPGLPGSGATSVKYRDRVRALAADCAELHSSRYPSTIYEVYREMVRANCLWRPTRRTPVWVKLEIMRIENPGLPDKATRQRLVKAYMENYQ